MPDIILSVLVVFVAFSVVSSSFLAGLLLRIVHENRSARQKLDDAHSAMETFASVNNENVTRMGQVLTDLQEKVQSHEIKLHGGINRPTPLVRQ